MNGLFVSRWESSSMRNREIGETKIACSASWIPCQNYRLRFGFA